MIDLPQVLRVGDWIRVNDVTLGERNGMRGEVLAPLQNNMLTVRSSDGQVWNIGTYSLFKSFEGQFAIASDSLIRRIIHDSLIPYVRVSETLFRQFEVIIRFF